MQTRAPSSGYARPAITDLLAESWKAPWVGRQALRAFALGGIYAALLRLQGVSLSRGAVFFGHPIVQRYRGSKIIVGRRFESRNYASANAVGCSHPLILSTRSHDARIVIGDDVGITGGIISATECVRVGDGCLLGADCVIVDSDFHPLEAGERRYRRTGIRTAPVSIGDNVFLGLRTIVLKGVTIGANSIVGAGSVVTHSIPENVIAAGNPARPVAGLDRS